MQIEVCNTCSDYQSYRAQRVKSLFNVESGCDFHRTFELELEEDWNVGIVVGPSGSGKTSLGHRLVEDAAFRWWNPRWPTDKPIVDAIDPRGDFDGVTGALASVGLGDVPAWLRPYPVLSNGERFRASLARLLADGPERVVLDEFTSVVDRQIACIGAMAFAKAWKRTGKQAVLLTCHYDVLEWVEPDWVLDTATGEFEDTRGLLTRPKVHIDIRETGWSYWDSTFKDHHYLPDAGPMAFATAYVGFVQGEPVAHLGMSGKVSGRRREARACRMVVLPEWQGAGIGMRFLNALCQRELDGDGFIGTPTNTLFHTAHPALVSALKRDRKWRQVSSHLHGGNRRQGILNMRKTTGQPVRGGFGGHFRGVTGWRYYGVPGGDGRSTGRS